MPVEWVRRYLHAERQPSCPRGQANEPSRAEKYGEGEKRLLAVTHAVGL